MGPGFRVERGTINGRVCGFEYAGRGVRYWADIRDRRDARYPLVCCRHEHRTPAQAVPCVTRLVRIVTRLALRRRCGTYVLTPAQIRRAVMRYMQAETARAWGVGVGAGRLRQRTTESAV